MHHHLALSATLAEQHRDDLRHQAEQARLARGGRDAREAALACQLPLVAAGYAYDYRLRHRTGLCSDFAAE